MRAVFDSGMSPASPHLISVATSFPPDGMSAWRRRSAGRNCAVEIRQASTSCAAGMRTAAWQGLIPRLLEIPRHQGRQARRWRFEGRRKDEWIVNVRTALAAHDGRLLPRRWVAGQARLLISVLTVLTQQHGYEGPGGHPAST